MRYLIGIDGGGTRTTVALADAAGRELTRTSGPAGLVDPRAPVATARVLISVVRQTLQQAGVTEPAAVLCAGLAGVANQAERDAVRSALHESGIAERVLVVCDGDIALEGAFRGGPGILLIAGTGSVAYGRGEDGRVQRCGGWGMFVGDEGSGYAIGRAALIAALRSADGRGPATRLLPVLLERLGLADPLELPPRVARSFKSDLAALVPDVVRLADQGEATALEVLRREAHEQALHAAALVERLAPWHAEPQIVFFGGVFHNPLFCDLVIRALLEVLPGGFHVQEPAQDAVGGALRMAVGALEDVPADP
jgi:glucosamine kinase